MHQPRVLVIGGSGFIGRSIVARLVNDGRKVLVPARRELRAREVSTLPGVEVERANVLDRTQLAGLIARADVVINLVGILHSRSGHPYGPDFARLHVDLPHNIVAAMQATPNGPRRLLHMSALGADKKAPSMYLRSKADGEAVVRGEAAAAGVALTVFRPSVVFGPDDQFLNLFASLARLVPVLALGGANARFQPVHVGDVAQAFANALDNPATYGNTYSLCGPRAYSLRELVRLAAAATGSPRPVIALPEKLGQLQAWLLEHMPGGPLMSRDNLDSMRLDNIAPAGWTMAPELGLSALTTVEQHLGSGLKGDGAQGRFNFLRARGRR
jgi:NADH dehydrogenase